MSIPRATYVPRASPTYSFYPQNCAKKEKPRRQRDFFGKHKKDLCANKGLGMAHPNGFVASKASVIAIVTRSVNRVYGNKVHCVLCVSALQNLLILLFCRLCPLRATNSNATRLICLCLRSPKKRPLRKQRSWYGAPKRIRSEQGERNSDCYTKCQSRLR